MLARLRLWLLRAKQDLSRRFVMWNRLSSDNGVVYNWRARRSLPNVRNNFSFDLYAMIHFSRHQVEKANREIDRQLAAALPQVPLPFQAVPAQPTAQGPSYFNAGAVGSGVGR